LSVIPVFSFRRQSSLPRTLLFGLQFFKLRRFHIFFQRSCACFFPSPLLSFTHFLSNGPIIPFFFFFFHQQLMVSVWEVPCPIFPLWRTSFLLPPVARSYNHLLFPPFLPPRLVFVLFFLLKQLVRFFPRVFPRSPASPPGRVYSFRLCTPPVTDIIGPAFPPNVDRPSRRDPTLCRQP